MAANLRYLDRLASKSKDSKTLVIKDCQQIQVAVPAPMPTPLSYAFDTNINDKMILPGMRVLVPLGRREVVGVVVGCKLEEKIQSKPIKLKAILSVFDEAPLFDNQLMSLFEWVSRYYCYPIGQVMQYVLPTLLRKGKQAEQNSIVVWSVSQSSNEDYASTLSRSPKQLQLITFIAGCPSPVSSETLNVQFEKWRPAVQQLVKKGLLRESHQVAYCNVESDQEAHLELSAQQEQALKLILADSNRFSTHLIDGVTGSGKTEVYLQLVQSILNDKSKSSVLILVPEIGLTPQIVSRFKQRFAIPIVVLHSGLSERERLNNWMMAKTGDARIVIGTRSSIFVPMPQLALIIIDEEHDISFKQQDGLRYSARDVAIKRAHELSIPIVLGSATPSLESFYNAWQKKYQHLRLTERAGDAKPPPVHVIDIKSQALQDGLSNRLITAMREHLTSSNQVMLFLNRRGFAPTLLCHSCGWVSQCDRCDSHMVLYQKSNRQRCQHCNSERAIPITCPICKGKELIAIGEGTERVEQALVQLFPDDLVLRIDGDTTRKKGSLASLLDEINLGGAKILLGTQMLAKGHHFPNVTMVGILNIDQGMFSVDFRAMERMAQLITQVSGRAGRSTKPGEVFLQTHHPEHPLLLSLIKSGYADFAKQTLDERKLSGMPPSTYLALLRAESVVAEKATQFLHVARQLGEELESNAVTLLGPTPAPMLRRAGRYRAQLLVHTIDRKIRQQFLTRWVASLEKSKAARQVRWSLDVDPMEMF